MDRINAQSSDPLTDPTRDLEGLCIQVGGEEEVPSGGDTVACSPQQDHQQVYHGDSGHDRRRSEFVVLSDAASEAVHSESVTNSTSRACRNEEHMMEPRACL